MLFFVVVPICIGLSIRFASPVHPFMLADNRHYVFYLWKKIMSKKYVRYGLLPLGHDLHAVNAIVAVDSASPLPSTSTSILRPKSSLNRPALHLLHDVSSIAAVVKP